MDKFLIKGGKPLNGTVVISGAKNAALPIIAAALLTTDNVTLHNIPKLRDIDTMMQLLTQMGATVSSKSWALAQPTNSRLGQGPTNQNGIHDQDVCIQMPSIKQPLVAPYDLVKTMRASILVLGPLLARFGQVDVSLPGGCAIGSRPVDLHVKALSAMGADIKIENGFIRATSPNGRLTGKVIIFDTVTVTGTENVLMAATLASGKTLIKNAAREPEIVDLADFLIQMGAKITGAGTSIIEVEGVESLSGGTYSIMPDRIEAGTFLAAGAITGGKATVTSVRPDHLLSLLCKFEEAGASLSLGENWVTLDMHGKRPQAVDISTAPYPGVATDMQAQFMAMNTVAEGNSTIIENIFENRFMHVHELQRMGASIRINGNMAVITGVPKLTGAPVMATDLRASAGLILAGLVAEHETTVDRIYHVDRGYERIEEKLSSLGADITRIKNSD